MTGPEHYQQAEQLVQSSSAAPANLQRAQVHATLALAAATALVCDDGLSVYDAWCKVAAT